VIYVWARDGSLVERIPRENLLAGQHNWAVAVQDWKSLGGGRILLGGIDKSAARPANHSTAVVEVLNIPLCRSEAVMRLPAVPGHTGSPTREGLALRGERLWLLPQDLNAGAALHEFRAVGLSQSGN
jgi:hypothetical protein